MRVTLEVVLGLWFTGFLPVSAQSYPNRPIKLVIPYLAGSAPDVVGRQLVSDLKRHIPQATIVVENIVGNSGTKGAEAVHAAPADGYTLLMGRVATQAIAPAFTPSLSYNWNDFTFLGLLELEPQICVVSAKSPYKTLRELLDTVRKSPGTLKFGHTGENTILNLSVRYMLKLEGLGQGDLQPVDLTHVSNNIPNSLEAGHIDFACTNASAEILKALRDERIHALFSTTAGRIPELPNLKNAREVGFPDLANMMGWAVLVGPADLPRQALDYWKMALSSLSKDNERKVQLVNRGAIQAIGGVKDNDHFLRQQYLFYKRIITLLELRQ